jgi:hypothetical protein
LHDPAKGKVFVPEKSAKLSSIAHNGPLNRSIRADHLRKNEKGVAHSRGFRFIFWASTRFFDVLKCPIQVRQGN